MTLTVQDAMTIDLVACESSTKAVNQHGLVRRVR